MVSTLRTPTGIRIRPIRPTDLEHLEAFYAGLSPESLNARFHGAGRGIAEGTARRFCGPDHAHREGLVAVTADEHEQIVGHLCLEPLTSDGVEMAIAVSDTWQRHGIGRALLETAVEWAGTHHVDRLAAVIRWSNPAILGLLRSIHRPLRITTTADGEIEAIVSIGNRLPVAA